MMTDAARDTFLRNRRVGVLSIARNGKPPLASPVWYDYDGTCFRIHVEATSAKAKLVGRVGTEQVSFTVQSEVPPYRYVVAYGTASLRPTGNASLRQRVARRYFGRLVGDMYLAEEEKRGITTDTLRLIEIVPERFVSYDFRPEAGALGRLYFSIYRWLRPVPA